MHTLALPADTDVDDLSRRFNNDRVKEQWAGRGQIDLRSDVRAWNDIARDRRTN